MRFPRRFDRNPSSRPNRRLRLGLESLEDRKTPSTVHPVDIAERQGVMVSITVHSRPTTHAMATTPGLSLNTAAVFHQTPHVTPPVKATTVHASMVKAAANPAPYPVPNALLPYEHDSVTGQQAAGSPFYSSFVMNGNSPDWKANGILDYFGVKVGAATEYVYSIYTQDGFGTWSKVIVSSAPYYSPAAPTSLVHSSPRYMNAYASPPSHGVGGPVFSYAPPSPTSFLPGYQTYTVSGTKIPNDPYGTYSSFTVNGSNPSSGSSGIFNYWTANGGYYYSMYTHTKSGSWGTTVESAVPYTSPYAPKLFAEAPYPY